ncbi:SDR family NAD(P)-dependent oxidoreductase [Cypionkella aquatica]|nr:SDR family oxidoreductase [Cypionkella aquatica]
MLPLQGKVALVTGASAPRGIGRAIALRLAADGAAVVVTDVAGSLVIDGADVLRLTLLDGLVSEIAAMGGVAFAQKLDVTSAADIAVGVETTLAQFQRLDILVNNAGSLSGVGEFLAATPAQWQTSFEVNLLGPMLLAQAVIPHMRKAGGGRIINIGSTGSLGAEPGFAAYTTMKHGLVGLSKTIAAEFGPDGILCNTVCPGYIATDMHLATNERLAKERGFSVAEIKQDRYAQVALRNAGLPEDVANAVAFLAGPQGAYVTGINLPVSGGVPFGI